MLGFSVSEATVSRYLRARGRRPGQSWRTFVRNQAMAFAHREYAEERSRATLACRWSPIGPSSGDRGQARLRGYGLGPGAALPNRSRPWPFGGLVCAPLSALPQLRIALPPWPAPQGESHIVVPGLLFRFEVHRSMLGECACRGCGGFNTSHFSAKMPQNSSCWSVPRRTAPTHQLFETVRPPCSRPLPWAWIKF